MKEEMIVHVPKIWGTEKIIANDQDYCGKLLFIDEEATSSTHCHKVKKETFFCLSGKILLKIGDTEIILDSIKNPITIYPGEYHQFIGLERSVILEISTHHEDSDSYRLCESKPGKNNWTNLTLAL